MDVRQTPGYWEGFQDAAQIEPLFDDAHPHYRAGWEGYWTAREAYEQMFGPLYPHTQETEHE